MRLRLAAIAFSLAAGAAPVSAEPYSWLDEPFWERPSRPQRYDRRQDIGPPPAFNRGAESLRNGGARPEIAPEAPPVVAFNYPAYAAGSIVIDSGGRKLYFVLPGNRAFQYPISVGREGFAWAGTETISRKQAWPDWHPPAEMRKRDPKLPEKMTGGLRNPLGAMALYLGSTLYRIHGTNDEKTIGHASSSGCFRMMNSAVVHLTQFAQVGTSVTVVNALPRAPQTPVATHRPQRPAAPQPPVWRDDADSEPPSVAARAPARPPVATTRPQRPAPPPPPAWQDDVDSETEPAPARSRGPAPRYEDDVADVTVTPRRSVDDYDPYVVHRPFGSRRFARQSYDDWAYEEAPAGYASRRPRERIWYDDERDDY